MENELAQINQHKKQILQQIRSHKHTAPLELFYKTFNQDHPADPEFLSRLYNELNKLGLVESGFKLLQETSVWHPEDAGLEELRATAKKIYFDSLVLEGATILTDRKQKKAKFVKDPKQVNSSLRQKIREENEKLLANMILKALEAYKKAYELNKDSLPVLNGLHRCYTVLQEPEKAEHFAMLAKEKSTFTQPRKEEKEKEKLDDEVLAEKFKSVQPDINEFHINEVNNFYEQGKYIEVIKRVDSLHFLNKASVPLLVSKAKAYVKLKKFKQANKVIFEAERYDTHLKLIKKFKTDLLEEKFHLLTKAGDFYLSKAVKLGEALGQEHFRKASICFKKALIIFPSNLDILDSYYTCMKYLKKDEEAFRTKALIYDLNSQWIPTSDRNTDGLCFIAAYAYPDQPQLVRQFRWFRREFLLASNFGKHLNSYYVRNSPKIVSLAKKNGLSPRMIRFLLYPILKLIHLLKILIENYHNK